MFRCVEVVLHKEAERKIYQEGAGHIKYLRNGQLVQLDVGDFDLSDGLYSAFGDKVFAIELLIGELFLFHGDGYLFAVTSCSKFDFIEVILLIGC